MSGPYGSAALAYWRAGWHGTLPLPRKAKANPPTGWTGRKGGWPSRADIQVWLEDNADGNIALRMPPHVIGIDVDDYDGKGGGANLAALEDKYGPLPATWKSTSRDDGVSGIRLFIVPEGLRWPGDLGNGIEVIQTKHRYVVAPPSIHPEGRTYRWITPAGVTALPDNVPYIEALPNLPLNWVAGLTNGEADVDVAKATLADAEVVAWVGEATPTPCPLVQDSLDRYIAELRSGSRARHEVGKNGTARLLHLHGEGHNGVLTALLALRKEWIRALAGSREQREAEAEWHRLVTGAVQIAAAENPKPRATDPCDWPTLLVQQAQAPAIEQVTTDSHDDQPAAPVDEEHAAALLEAQAAFNRAVADEVQKIKVREQARRLLAAEGQTRRPTPKRLDTFLLEPDPPIVYRAEGLWPAGGRVLLTAAFKAGKSTLNANVMRCLVDGGDLLGHWRVEPVAGQVVLVDNELDEATLRRWLREQGITNTHRITVLSLRGAASSFDILDPHVRAQWAAMVRGEGASVLILDCLRPVLDALGLDEHKDAGRFLTAFDELLSEAGVPEAVVVHHAGHEGERARGDSRLRDWPDVEWRLVREKGEDTGAAIDPSARRYFAAYGRDVNVPEGALDYDEVSRRLSYEGGSRGEAKANAVLPMVIDALRENPEGLSGRAVEEWVTNAGASRGEARKALKVAVQRRLVKVVEGARRARIHVLPEASELVDNQSGAPVRRSAPNPDPRTAVECASAPIGAHGALTARPERFSAPSAPTGALEIEGHLIDPRTGEVVA